MNEDVDFELMQLILGDIAANENYGLVMKKWRDLFNLTQSTIARELDIKQSVISDYENNRRKSPGIQFLRKYTKAIIKLGKEDNREQYNKLINRFNIKYGSKGLVEGDFDKKLSIKQVLDLLNATQILSIKTSPEFTNYIFFSDNISSIITEEPSYKLLKGLKTKDKRVFIFSNVKTGRVPLIALKILTKLNKIQMPKLVVFQTEKFKLSSFTRKLAKKNNISIALTNMSNERIKESLNENSENFTSD